MTDLDRDVPGDVDPMQYISGHIRAAALGISYPGPCIDRDVFELPYPWRIQQVSARFDTAIQSLRCPAGCSGAAPGDRVLYTHGRQREADAQRKARKPQNGLAPVRLRRVREYIDAHLSEKMSLVTLARIACLSPNYFASAFKASTGLPPHRYVLQRRIEKAKELLSDKSLSVSEVVYMLGFPSQSHFTTTFRKLTGETPGAYRERV
jgi:AraC-like DNA-binding protein